MRAQKQADDMIDPIAFIEARLAADEQTAKAAIGAGERGEWTADGCCVEGDIHIYDEGGHDERQAEHIARHDPARALREVEAKRWILAQCCTAREAWEVAHAAELASRDANLVMGRQEVRAANAAWTVYQAWYKVLTGLAPVWSDHPDYRAEWT